MAHRVNIESKVVVFPPELPNEVNPSENLPDSSNVSGDTEQRRVMEHVVHNESQVVAFPPELLNEVNPSDILPGSSSVSGDIEHGRLMEQGVNTESKVVAFLTELLNEVNPSENLLDSSSLSGDIEHGRVMEHRLNIERKVVALDLEFLNEVNPSEILPDSSSVSGDIEHRRLMEHRVNIECDIECEVVAPEVRDEVNPIENLPDSSSVSGGIDFLITGERIEEKIHDLPPLHPEPSIFIVHEGLRKVNEKAYTPTLVSIGPYHHKNSDVLRAMEEHKLRYFHSLFQRVRDNNKDKAAFGTIGSYLSVLGTMVDRAQACYANPICLERDEFLEMLLLDTCFIIEFLRKLYLAELRDKDDPIFKSSWMLVQICRDLMLLENQIPFFVLSEMFSITLNQRLEKFPLIVLAVQPIMHMLPRRYSFKKAIQQIQQIKRSACDIKHFLHLLHILYVPTFEKPSAVPTRKKKKEKPSADSGGQEVCPRMFSVTELQEAGISFRVDDSDDVSIFDISFEHGRMKIPKFKVADRTETFFRNIVAYEQHCSSDEPKYFTDYRYFINLLINTGKDANALRLRKIIYNMLGDDEEVATMFNRMGDGVIIQSTFYYSHICQKVNGHCEQPWNKAKAKLRRNYFYNRWASISTVAAGVLLLLTLIQTIVALIALFS